jgi:hypothetical protein
MTDSEPVFVIFDSLPRPKHPKGAGFIFNISHLATANYLNNLLAIDHQLLAESGEGWQAGLLGNLSVELFVSRAAAHLLDMTQGSMSLGIQQMHNDTKALKVLDLSLLYRHVLSFLTTGKNESHFEYTSHTHPKGPFW